MIARKLLTCKSVGQIVWRSRREINLEATKRAHRFHLGIAVRLLLFVPHLVEHLRCDGSLVLRQEATVVLLHHVGRVLDGIARLFV